MAADKPNKFTVWFQRVVWIGILANFALAIPTLLAPEMMIKLVGVPPATPVMWVRFSALLLVLLSLFYIPAARDCVRYRPVAVMTVLSRLAGVLFFSTQAVDYRMFGVFDGVFLIPEGILLFLATRSAAPANRSADRQRV
jgi:hypothetical protein